MTTIPKIAVINASTVVDDRDLATMTVALQKAVTRDFLPNYPGLGYAAVTLDFVPRGGTAAPGDWQMAILDDSDQAGALGYHDLTAGGQPLGKVFAKTDLRYGDSVSVTLAHEMFEILADPMINQTIKYNRRTFAYEVCDPCEADRYAYDVDGVKISDFILPSYFNGKLARPYDFCKQLTGRAPKLLPGGYISVYSPKTGWTQLTADATPSMRSRPVLGSRRERRRTPRDQWVKSTNPGVAGAV